MKRSLVSLSVDIVLELACCLQERQFFYLKFDASKAGHEGPDHVLEEASDDEKSSQLEEVSELHGFQIHLES